MSDKYIGKLLDNRYEILEQIGTGGMAVVYKALCHRLNRYVAVKILKDEYAKDEEFRNRFHEESHAVAMLSHPNIVAVYDVSRSNSVEYIVMELIDGMTLKQYMDRRGALSQREAIHFTIQILSALSHAHSKGIIHRDIKPHNIMLLRDGTVRVADFGIARLESSQKTVIREAFGSVHYISPEQAKGSNIDCRADIYSTGVVLYEMLTGRLPYEGDTPVAIAVQHINSLPLSPREINPEIPETLEKITMKAMASALPRRYATTDDMIADLEAFRKNPDIDIEYEPPRSRDEEDLSETRPVTIIKEKPIEIRKEPTSLVKEKLPILAPIIAGGIFLIGIITLLGTLFGWWNGNAKAPAETPYVIGMTIEEASKMYGDFEIIESDEGTREYSDKYDEDVILKQRPEADSANSSGKIYVTLSRGKRDDVIVLSDLYNMGEDQAKIVLNRAGLVCIMEEENSEDVAKGYVIRTEPEEGTELSEGDEVKVYISLGKAEKEATVPKIVGLSEEKAIEALTAANLQKGSIGYENSDSVKKGVVIRQDVTDGETRSEGTSVGFTVSLGPKKSESAENPSSSDVPASSTGEKSEAKTTADANAGADIKITREIRLPDTPETFMVKITVNGKIQYEKQHSGTDGSVNVTLSGKGESTVSVYIDNQIRQEISIDFR